MSNAREVIQEVSGFYPLFEELLKRYEDLITPAVFGVAWRYCQMKDGVCKASLRTIAGILNVSEATVMRRMEILCNDGYLIDTTPDARNIPHIYADAGLVVMKSSLGVIETVSHRNTTKTVSRRNTTVSQGNTTVSESQLIKDSIKDSNKGMAPPDFDFENMTMAQAYKVPTLKMFKEATGWIPADILWRQVHEYITAHNLTHDQIKAAAVSWVGRGYNRRNVMGILEWAAGGVPGNGQKSGEAKPAIDEETVKKTIEELTEKWNFKPAPPPSTRPRIGQQGKAS